jgi:hypothetical protein
MATLTDGYNLREGSFRERRGLHGLRGTATSLNKEMVMPVSMPPAIIRVGDGRGFVVEGRGRSLVITASHCLPHLPPRHPAAHMHERMHRNLLGRLGSELTVWTEALLALVRPP